MAPFYGWGSTVSWLLSHYEEVYFLPFSSQKFLVLNAYVVIKDPDFESKRKRTKKCQNLEFLFLILMHNNFRQLLSL